LKDCQEETLRLLGATDADIAAFRQRLGVIEGKVREMQRLSEDKLLARQDDVKALENELNELRGNKISLIPEFYNKIIALAKDIRGLYREKKITTYTVGTWAENRDCLWNIAGKIDIYSDPFMWPKIWQGNTDQIRNPDIIHPGQVLQIPAKGPKTSDELKAERKYWRMKKEAQAEAAANAQTGGVQ
jgi:nucleoid-associated protein YgaU